MYSVVAVECGLVRFGKVVAECGKVGSCLGVVVAWQSAVR